MKRDLFSILKRVIISSWYYLVYTLKSFNSFSRFLLNFIFVFNLIAFQNVKFWRESLILLKGIKPKVPPSTSGTFKTKTLIIWSCYFRCWFIKLPNKDIIKFFFYSTRCSHSHIFHLEFKTKIFVKLYVHFWCNFQIEIRIFHLNILTIWFFVLLKY